MLHKSVRSAFAQAEQFNVWYNTVQILCPEPFVGSIHGKMAWEFIFACCIGYVVWLIISNYRYLLFGSPCSYAAARHALPSVALAAYDGAVSDETCANVPCFPRRRWSAVTAIANPWGAVRADVYCLTDFTLPAPVLPLFDLPDNVLLRVAELLPCRDRNEMRGTSRRCRQAANLATSSATVRSGTACVMLVCIACHGYLQCLLRYRSPIHLRRSQRLPLEMASPVLSVEERKLILSCQADVERYMCQSCHPKRSQRQHASLSPCFSLLFRVFRAGMRSPGGGSHCRRLPKLQPLARRPHGT